MLSLLYPILNCLFKRNDRNLLGTTMTRSWESTWHYLFTWYQLLVPGTWYQDHCPVRRTPGATTWCRYVSPRLAFHRPLEESVRCIWFGWHVYPELGNGMLASHAKMQWMAPSGLWNTGTIVRPFCCHGSFRTSNHAQERFRTAGRSKEQVPLRVCLSACWHRWSIHNRFMHMYRYFITKRRNHIFQPVSGHHGVPLVSSPFQPHLQGEWKRCL